MDSLEEEMRKWEEEREKERLAFLKKCHEKITDDSTVYLGLSYIIANRFRISESYHGSGFHDVVYDILNYYVDNVDEDFMKWLHKDDGPFVKTPKQILKIFPEFSCITDSAFEIMKIANQMYGLDMKYDSNDYHGTYIYAYSFDYNSFTPVDIEAVKSLKDEIKVLEKHGVDTSDLQAKLESYGFTKEQLEMI